jgi:hypothetical protein
LPDKIPTVNRSGGETEKTLGTTCRTGKSKYSKPDTAADHNTPRFFKGTAIEKAVADELGLERASPLRPHR